MSDGMSDARALERQVRAVIDAAARLGEALREAQDGVRGLVAVDVLHDANLQLNRFGFFVVHKCSECGLPVRDVDGAAICRDHKHS